MSFLKKAALFSILSTTYAAGEDELPHEKCETNIAVVTLIDFTYSLSPHRLRRELGIAKQMHEKIKQKVTGEFKSAVYAFGGKPENHVYNDFQNYRRVDVTDKDSTDLQKDDGNSFDEIERIAGRDYFRSDKQWAEFGKGTVYKTALKRAYDTLEKFQISKPRGKWNYLVIFITDGDSEDCGADGKECKPTEESGIKVSMVHLGEKKHNDGVYAKITGISECDKHTRTAKDTLEGQWNDGETCEYLFSKTYDHNAKTEAAKEQVYDWIQGKIYQMTSKWVYTDKQRYCSENWHVKKANGGILTCAKCPAGFYTKGGNAHDICGVATECKPVPKKATTTTIKPPTTTTTTIKPPTKAGKKKCIPYKRGGKKIVANKAKGSSYKVSTSTTLSFVTKNGRIQEESTSIIPASKQNRLEEIIKKLKNDIQKNSTRSER